MKPFVSTIAGPRVWRTLSCKEILSTANHERYKFDRIYGEEMGTEDIFKDHYQGMIHQAMRGYNVTIFAYGQTSSGKTHTMYGDLMESGFGLIPLSSVEIFKKA